MKKDNCPQIEKFYAAVKELGLDDDGQAVDGFLARIAEQRDEKPKVKKAGG